MNLIDLLRPTGTMDRGHYALAGILLFVLKYNIDRVVTTQAFERPWSITSYLDVPGVEAVTALGKGDTVFGLTLVAIALPFIWIGTTLTLKRLRAAGLPGWFVLGFFVPLVNLVFFAVLCVIPGSASDSAATRQEAGAGLLDRLIPEGRLASAAMALALTAPAGLIGVFLSVNVFRHYGWSLFVGIPFGLGMVAAMLHGYHRERSASECMVVAVMSVAILGGLLALVAAEGVICLVMAAPIAVSLAVIGGGMGFAIQRRPVTGSAASVSLVVLGILPLLIVLEGIHDERAPLVSVRTSVSVDASPQQVWSRLIAFSEIPEPEQWMFKTGIAYPIRATIEGRGVGAVRRCEFSTGAFVEPITVWREPEELSFVVESMPHPMQEWTFYRDVRPVHIDGYFATERGRFLLRERPDGGTVLEGTTWYRNQMWPNRYWNLWADAILQKIHHRVLEHIKREAEAGVLDVISTFASMTCPPTCSLASVGKP